MFFQRDTKTLFLTTIKLAFMKKLTSPDLISTKSTIIGLVYSVHNTRLHRINNIKLKYRTRAVRTD